MTEALQPIKTVTDLEEITRELPQADIPATECIIGSMYTREILIPKDHVLTGRVYKRGYVDIMLSGDITITDTNGTYRLTGYNLLEGPAGRKRAGYAHEDTRWLTVHDLRDIKSNPTEDISFVTIAEFIEFDSKNARDSYEGFLLNNDLKEETVRGQSENEPYSAIEGPFYLGDSPIEGKGVFAKTFLGAGNLVGPTLDKGKKTQLGRYVNHSDYPNTIYAEQGLMVTRAIDTGQEITVNYGHSPRLLK